MRAKLAVRALTKYLLGAALVGALVFVPAGTLHYPGGFMLMGLLFLPMLLMGVVLLIQSPALLESRLKARETRGTQKGVVLGSAAMFLIGFTLAGLDHRFGWLPLPGAVRIAASALFLIAYLLYAQVLRQNAYLSRTIGVQKGQKVIRTGLYGVVRHPMYFATVLLFWAMPLVLGSAVALLAFLPYPLLLVRRIRDEEALLRQELDGYADYQNQVRWRLLPFIW